MDPAALLLGLSLALPKERNLPELDAQQIVDAGRGIEYAPPGTTFPTPVPEDDLTSPKSDYLLLAARPSHAECLGDITVAIYAAVTKTAEYESYQLILKQGKPVILRYQKRRCADEDYEYGTLINSLHRGFDKRARGKEVLHNLEILCEDLPGWVSARP